MKRLTSGSSGPLGFGAELLQLDRVRLHVVRQFSSRQHGLEDRSHGRVLEIQVLVISQFLCRLLCALSRAGSPV